MWLAFAAVIFSIYGWYVDNPFVMDDVLQVLENRHIQSLENWPGFFTSSSMSSAGAKTMAGIYYKPLMTSYYAIVWSMFQDSPWAYRLPIFFLQATNAFLMFTLSLEFLPVNWAFALGLLFELHPANAEMILYVADVQDVLYLFFGLLALVAILRLKQRSWWAVSGATFAALACSLLSKETGGLFVPIALAWTAIVNRKAFNSVAAACVAVSLAYFSIRTAIGLVHTENPALLMHRADYWTRLSMVPMILAHYIEILFIPWRISLGTDFILEKLTTANFVLPIAVTAGFLYLLLAKARVRVKRVGVAFAEVGTAAAEARVGADQIKSTQIAKTRKSGPALFEKRELHFFDFFLFVLILWFILHGQVFVPIDAVWADRWLPLAVWAALGIGMLTLRTFPQFSEAKRAEAKAEFGAEAKPGGETDAGATAKGTIGNSRMAEASGRSVRALTAACCALALAYVVRDFIRAQDWTSPIVLYRREATIHPWDAVMTNNVGVELFNAGQWQESAPWFEKATELNPGWNVAWNNRGAIEERLGRFDAALGFYKKSYELGAYALAYENYGKLLCKLGRTSQCRDFVQSVLPRYPYNPVLLDLAKSLGISIGGG